MARIRSIKPEFWTSEQVMECSMVARLLFIGLWNFADDLGRLSFAPKTIKAQIFPSDDVSSDDVRRMIDELSTNGLVLIYEVDGKDYIQITGWQHQKIDRPQPGKYPSPVNGYKSAQNSHSSNDRRTFATDRKGEEGKGEERISEANASGAVAPRDFRAELFQTGLAKLAAMTGKGPDSCRSFVGKCLKAAGDDAVIVLGLIEDAERNKVADPSAWIAARLKATGPPSNTVGKPLTEFQRKQAETNHVRDHLRNISSGGEGGGAFAGLLSDDHGQRPEAVRDGAGAGAWLLPPSPDRARG